MKMLEDAGVKIQRIRKDFQNGKVRTPADCEVREGGKRERGGVLSMGVRWESGRRCRGISSQRTGSGGAAGGWIVTCEPPPGAHLESLTCLRDSVSREPVAFPRAFGRSGCCLCGLSCMHGLDLGYLLGVVGVDGYGMRYGLWDEIVCRGDIVT
ncbi:hypothetical protein Tco_0794979 [Tanacetum coccineum]